MQAAEFLIGDRRYTREQVLHSNRFDQEFSGWAESAVPGDVFDKSTEPQVGPVRCVEPIYVAQCPQESLFVRCSLPDGHEGECSFPVKRRWKCSFAQDVPYYADFTVPAESQEEAQLIIDRLLHSGQLEQIMDGHAQVDWSGADNDRAFVSDEEEDVDDEHGMLETFAREAKIELPPKWAVPPAAPNPALALMRAVLKAQLALWDAQGALEGHIAAVEFKEVDVSEQSTSEAVAVYSDAREIDSADDAEILRIYQAVLTYGAAGAANVEPPMEERVFTANLDAAREYTRMAELSLRGAYRSSIGAKGGGPASIVLYDLLEPATKIAEKVSHLIQVMKNVEGGAQ